MPLTLNGTTGIVTANLADASVTTPKIADSAVATVDIANGAVTAAKLSGAQTGSAPVYGCRAWVNFDGTRDSSGTTSTANTNRFIRSSGNVSSVFRNATGDYTITLTAAMPSADYVISNSTGGTGVPSAFRVMDDNTPRTASGFRIASFNSTTAAAVDIAQVNIAIFG